MADSSIVESAAPASSRAVQSPVTLIVPPRRWQMINVAELWRFRDLAFQLAWRDVKVRYKQTVLGAGWAILQPAMMMVVFAAFFGGTGRVSSGDLPYPAFVYAGLLPWIFFAGAVTAAAQSVVGSERLITKIYFPRLAIPFAAVAAAALDAVIAFALLAGLMAWYGIPPRPVALIAPLILVAVALTAAGVGTFLAALNVAYRDVRYVIPFFIQVGLFATPSVYTQTASLSGGGVRSLVALNPMVALVSAFRGATLGGAIDWGQLAISLAIGVGLLVAGCLYFRRVEDSFADTI
jgi:lipopolysaccharide transport system permease protein